MPQGFFCKGKSLTGTVHFGHSLSVGSFGSPKQAPKSHTSICRALHFLQFYIPYLGIYHDRCLNLVLSEKPIRHCHLGQDWAIFLMNCHQVGEAEAESQLDAPPLSHRRIFCTRDQKTSSYNPAFIFVSAQGRMRRGKMVTSTMLCSRRLKSHLSYVLCL